MEPVEFEVANDLKGNVVLLAIAGGIGMITAGLTALAMQYTAQVSIMNVNTAIREMEVDAQSALKAADFGG